jgi:hypothetical protein
MGRCDLNGRSWRAEPAKLTLWERGRAMTVQTQAWRKRRA